MAGARKKPGNEFGIPEDRLPPPQEFEDREMPDSWWRAYAYAANYSPHNGPKACAVYAEAHWQDEEYKD